MIKGVKVISKLGDIIVFAYQFRYLVDPNFKFYSPYLQWFNILIRRQNRYERSMGEDDDEVTKNMPMW